MRTLTGSWTQKWRKYWCLFTLKYFFLNPSSSLPIVIYESLHETREEKLLRVLRDNKEAFGWSIHELKDLDPTICTHRINTKEWSLPKWLPQRKLNPNMMEVVKWEVIKLLDVWIIYPIFDSPWVSLVQCVLKNTCNIVMENEHHEFIVVRKIIGW